MLTKSFCRVLPVMLMALFLAASAAAVVPESFVYQGRLADTSGAAIVSPTNVTFSIYSTPSGGTAKWATTSSVSPDANGIFTMEIGPLGDTVFTGDVMYLGIKVAADPEMAPRQVLSAAPYSLMAMDVPANSITTTQLANGSVTNVILGNGAVSNTKLAGNAVTGDKVSDGSLTDFDISDEPGIVRYTKSYSAIAASGVTSLDTATITVPSSGYVLAIANGYGTLASDGTIGNIIIGIETSPTTSPASLEYNAWGTNNSPYPSGQVWWNGMTAERVFFVASAGTYSFYLNAIRGWTGGTGSILSMKTVLLFIPTSYGTVSTIVSDGDNDQFSGAVPVDPGPVALRANNSPANFYQVDLRELELKAIKAELEAQKARNEYLDAKAKAEQQDK